MFEFSLRDIWAYIHHHGQRMKEQSEGMERQSRGPAGSVHDLARFFNG